MIWDHEKKLKELAVASMNRSGIHRLVKVIPHQPGRLPKTRVAGWVTQEKFILGKTPEEVERILGFDGRPGQEYLTHGFDVYVLTKPVRENDSNLKGAYTYLPAGRPWDRVDLKWPPGLGATQWQLEREIDCQFIKTVPRGQRY
jgi:hypothetical protein